MRRIERLRIDNMRTITFVWGTDRCLVKAFRGSQCTPDIKLTEEEGMHLYHTFINKGALRIL